MKEIGVVASFLSAVRGLIVCSMILVTPMKISAQGLVSEERHVSLSHDNFGFFQGASVRQPGGGVPKAVLQVGGGAFGAMIGGFTFGLIGVAAEQGGKAGEGAAAVTGAAGLVIGSTLAVTLIGNRLSGDRSSFVGTLGGSTAGLGVFALVAITTAMTVDSAGFIPGVLILPALGATVLNNLIAVPQPDSYALKPQPILAPGPNGRTMFGVGFAF